MIIKWKTESWNNRIHRVECTRETDSTVYIMGCSVELRRKKASDASIYHDSWDDAYVYLVRRQLDRISSTERLLESQRETLVHIQSMKDPNDTREK